MNTTDKKMKALLCVFALLVLAACTKPAETSTPANANFAVDTLFTHHGCTVYRFYDGGHARYFTDCKGQTSWSETCGKNCTREVGVQ